MTREEKLDLARELARRLLARHGEQAIQAVGVHGSVARGDDTQASDLDLAVITASPEVQVPDRALRYRGTVVGLGAIWADAYLDEARHIGPAWPVTSDQYVNHLAVHDPGGYFQRLRHAHGEAVAATPEETFRAAAGYDLVEAIDRHAKAVAALDHADPATAALALRDAALFAALAVGLVTRTTFHDAFHAVTTVATLEEGPPGFAEPFGLAVDPASPPEAAVGALGQALDSLQALARGGDIPFETDDLEAFL